MDQFINLWLAMDIRRRVTIVVASFAMFAAVLGLSRMATTPSESLLFSGLDSSAAGEVIAALDQRGVQYSVRASAIYVPTPKRDELRMSLAAEGLPAAGTTGYELLDTLTGFGTTSQMFDAAYWRAMEGELARTILASPHFRSARVHIGRETGTGLRREVPRTAAVTVSANGGAVSRAHAKALRFMVSSAVSGLSPEKVSVIDAANGSIFAHEDTSEAGGRPDDRALALKNNVERMLEARVGAGNVVVEVALEQVTETETISERRLDPDSRVAISTETEENLLDATEPSPDVTVASNLPTGAGGAAGVAGRSQNNQTRERTNYEVSETTRDITRAPGAIKKLSVAILVDGVETVNETGQRVKTARSADELQNLRELAASAVGFDEGRGDVITIHSMEFKPAPEVGSIAEPGFLQTMKIDVMLLVQLAILAFVTLTLGFGVIRPIALQAANSPAPVPSLAPPQFPDASPAIDGEVQTPFDTPTIASAPTGGASGGTPIGEMSSLDEIVEDPVERLKQLIEDRQEESVDILRGWMERDAERST